MNTEQKEEFLQNHINRIIREEIYLDENEYNWGIIHITHIEDIVCVEVKNQNEYLRDEDHSLLLFEFGSSLDSVKHLVTYNMGNDIWELHSHIKQMSPPSVVSKNFMELKYFVENRKTTDFGFMSKLFKKSATPFTSAKLDIQENRCPACYQVMKSGKIKFCTYCGSRVR